MDKIALNIMVGMKLAIFNEFKDLFYLKNNSGTQFLLK